MLNEEALEDLAVPEEYIERIAKKEIEEIGRRLALLRGEGRPESQVGGQIVILVDDGLVTGVTALAAVKALLRLPEPAPGPGRARGHRPDRKDAALGGR